tara:strand:+ start:542 stop:1339 length:798 start_codon:yes stop_codon:yes gene_type:complete
MNNPKKYLFNSLAIALLITAVSCVTSDHEDMAPTAKSIPSEEISGMMGLMEEVDLMVMSAMQQNLSQQRLVPLLDELSCPGTIITRDDKKGEIKIDFGNGCVSNRGMEKQGNLTIYYSGGFLSKGSQLTIDFENFSLNGHQMQGQRKLENLGYDPIKKSLRFSSVMNDFKLVNLEGQAFNLNQNYIRDLEISTDSDGFRIYLQGSGSLSTENYITAKFEIVRPLKYMQECIESGIADPIEGSLEISSGTEYSTILNFESEGCSSI